MKRAIIIMAKVPSAGNVKTRLQPFLSPNECAALAGSVFARRCYQSKTSLRKRDFSIFAARKNKCFENVSVISKHLY